MTLHTTSACKGFGEEDLNQADGFFVGGDQEDAASHLVKGQLLHVRRWQGTEGHPTAPAGVLSEFVL